MLDEKAAHITNDGVAVTIDRTTDYSGKAIVSRIKGSYSDYSVQNRRMINMITASNLTAGEVVATATESYLVVVARNEMVGGVAISIIANALLCNDTLTVSRETPSCDSYGNPTGATPSTALNAAPCHAVHVNSKMRETDAGLLPTTVLKVYAKSASGLILGDKAEVFDRYYRVDDINFAEYAGIMVLQLSAWAG